MRAAILGLLLCVLAAGCGPKDTAAPDAAPPEATGAGTSTPTGTPAEMLQENIRAGNVQLSLVLNSLTELSSKLREEQQGAQGEMAEGLSEVLDYVDSTGETLTEAMFEPPAVEEIEADWVKYDDMRLSLITAVNDAYLSLNSVLNILATLAEQKATLSVPVEMTETLLADLESAIQSLGGEVAPLD